MTFASQTSKEAATEMLRAFLALGHVEVDTARMYNHGKTEELIGQVTKENSDIVLSLASKANPFPSHNKILTFESVEAQLAATLRDLQCDCVDIFYLHAPDPKTPIMETLRAVDKAYKAGKFKEFGLSNYQAWEVAHIVHLCRLEGFPVPTVYQGMYNAITREVERELFPCLRALGLRFNAYNPLAGGLLTGKVDRNKLDDIHDGSRFDTSNVMYRKRYLGEPQLDAVDLVGAACAKHDVPPTRAALRWIKFHSKLVDDDGLILGASKMNHFQENLAALDDGPLPDDIVAAYDEAWGIVKAHGCCPTYERGTSLYE